MSVVIACLSNGLLTCHEDFKSMEHASLQTENPIFPHPSGTYRARQRGGVSIIESGCSKLDSEVKCCAVSKGTASPDLHARVKIRTRSFDDGDSKAVRLE